MQRLIVSTLPKDSPVAEAAIRELSATTADCRVIHTDEMNIHPCVGCNACWLKTPGTCAIQDDYAEILKAYLEYDTTVFLTGTALNFVDYRMKNIIDRLLPLVTMYLYIVDRQYRHIPRYDKRYQFGLLYDGVADQAYLNEWLERVMLNIGGNSLGAFPAAQAKEVFSCT